PATQEAREHTAVSAADTAGSKAAAVDGQHGDLGAGSTPGTGNPSGAPVVRIVTGSPTEAELAAVHAVIAAVLAEQSAAGVPRLEPRVDGWRQSGRQMRGLLAPGPGAWAASRGTRGC
ncbi:MAG: acyl-CoA carboxylase epsilon subunit, partial [Microcella sp.]|nr:acyl-CoA carboxylase epsilon subunit [Microcella sp.]